MEVRSGYKNSDGWVIPEDWKVESLLDLAGRQKERFDDGDWIEAEFLEKSGVRLIQTGNIGVGRFLDKESKKYISGESFDLLRCKELRAGDLLVCRLAEPAGRACIMPQLEDGRVITAVDVTIFRPLEDLTDRRYLLQQFGTRSWFSAISERCGGSTRTRISRGALGKINIPVPPTKAEQEAIAEALSDADALIESLEQLVAKKRQIKQGAMQELLTGERRLPGFSGEWEMKRVLDLGDVVTGGTPRTDVPEYWGDKYPWVTPTDISTRRDMSTSERGLTQKGLDAIRALPANSVLVTCIASIGKNAILTVSGACNQQINAVVPNQCSDAVFLYYVFEANKQYLVANSGTTATSIVSKATFSELTFFVPALSEQVAIATALSDIDAELSVLEARRDKAHQIKQGMMQELLTGRIRLV